MAEIKMPVFRSDAVFEGNVTINKTLTAFQIEEPVDKKIVTATYEEEKIETIDVNLTNPPLFYSVDFNLTLPNGAFNFSVTSCTAKVEYFYKEKEEDIGWTRKVETFEVTPTPSKNNKTFTASIKYSFPLEFDISSPQITFTLQYRYSVKEEKTPNSYFNKTLLYGENGILRDIQKRLENLENNFDQLKYSNAQQNITKNDLIIDLSAGNLVLEKSEYQIQNSITTNVNKILSDINLRLREAGV